MPATAPTSRSTATTTATRTSAFDTLFVDPVNVRPVSARSMPTGWRRAPLLTWLDEQPLERRETILALGFALLAFVYGPLGIVAVLANKVGLLAAVTVVAVVVIAAPRPSLSGHAVRDLVEGMRRRTAGPARG